VLSCSLLAKHGESYRCLRVLNAKRNCERPDARANRN
jgi:hypothetical protein